LFSGKMPSPNAIKTYVENGYYHMYNRGVEKRLIFQDRDDYSKFLYLLKVYLSPPEDLQKEFPLLKNNLVQNNLNHEIKLLCFCLMPNHYHLLVKQKAKNAIIKLMKQVSNAYTTYFNKRHERVGPLFQGRYKGALIDSDEYLLHLTRYIHLNPLGRGASLDEFDWSSYLYYLNKRQAAWLDTKLISEYFNNSKKGLSYQDFVEGDTESIDLPPSLTIEPES